MVPLPTIRFYPTLHRRFPPRSRDPCTVPSAAAQVCDLSSLALPQPCECCFFSMLIVVDCSICLLRPVADVLLWRRRNAAVLALAGATTVWFLFERAGYNFLSVVANATLLVVIILFFWAKSALLLNRFAIYWLF